MKVEKTFLKNMFLKTFFGVALLVMILPVNICMAIGPGFSDTEIRIGSILDQTGPIAYYGKVSAQAIIASVNEINAKGGIHGRKLVFLTESDGYNPAKHVAAAKKMVEKDDILCFANNLGSASAMALLPYIQKKKVPVIALLGSTTKLIGKKYMYMMSAGYGSQGQSIIDFLANDLKKANVSIGFIIQADESGRDYLKGAQKQMKKYPGLSTKAIVEVPRRALDVAATVLKMKKENPDVVVIAGPHVGNVSKLKKESFKLGWKPTFIISIHAADAAFPYLAKEAAEGDYVLSMYPLMDPSIPVVREYLTSLKKHFPKARPATVGLSSFLHFKVTVDVLKRLGRDISREKLVEALEILRDPDYKNLYIPAGHGKQYGGVQTFFSQVRKGKFVKVSDYQAPK